jgi:cbb3-type cytochrome oxidase maturation protein
MSVLFVALPLALLLGGAALVACVYCIKHGQYDDLESPAVRILIEDVSIPKKDPVEPKNS